MADKLECYDTVAHNNPMHQFDIIPFKIDMFGIKLFKAKGDAAAHTCEAPFAFFQNVSWLDWFGTGDHLGLSFTNSAFFMVLSVVTIAIVMALGAGNAKVIPGRMQAFVEMLYDMVFGFMKDMLGDKAKVFFPLIFAVFLYVLFGNLWGMITFPGFKPFTFTSHIAVTGFMAVFLFGMVIVLGIMKSGLLGWLGHFVPGGAPWYILPILVPIEVISYFVRPVTLSMRLFANMMAGHVALKVFGGFAVILGTTGIVVGQLLIIPVTLLEFLVAGLQAYVFAILTTSYIMDSVSDHH